MRQVISAIRVVDNQIRREDAVTHLSCTWTTRPRCMPGNVGGLYLGHTGPVTCLWCAASR